MLTSGRTSKLRKKNRKAGSARALGGEVRGGQILAPGPGHSPKDRSLRIKLDANAPDGFLVHSFADDDPIACRDHVRAKAGLPAFAPNGHKRARVSEEEIEKTIMAAMAAQADEPPKGRIVNLYDYTDEAGVLLYQVARLEPKDFRHRRPDGKGGWIWKLGDVRRVVYRLPELLQHPHATVSICEGEKDSDRLASLGHCATTVASGTWSGVDVSVLAGRDVFVLADADETGTKKALAAAKAVHGVAATIRIIRMPDGAKDVSAWLDADASRAARLVEHCVDTPLWEPEAAPAEAAAEEAPQAPNEPPPISSLDERDAGDDPGPIPPRGWLLGNQFCRKFLSSITAPGGTGKTALRMLQFISLATGRPLTGQHVFRRCRVLLLSFEDDTQELQRRITAALVHHKIDRSELKGWLFYAAPKNLKLAEMRNGTRQIGKLEKLLREAIERRCQPRERKSADSEPAPQLLGTRLFCTRHPGSLSREC
jgi:hypothetical protein